MLHRLPNNMSPYFLMILTVKLFAYITADCLQEILTKLFSALASNTRGTIDTTGGARTSQTGLLAAIESAPGLDRA